MAEAITVTYEFISKYSGEELVLKWGTMAFFLVIFKKSKPVGNLIIYRMLIGDNCAFIITRYQLDAEKNKYKQSTCL